MDWCVYCRALRLCPLISAIDRVLYKGAALNLSVYSRAELKGSDHRPGLYLCFTLWTPLIFGLVFGIFSAEVRVIDQTKRANLSHLLLENVTSTAPGEKLDEKLAALTFSNDTSERKCPGQLRGQQSHLFM